MINILDAIREYEDEQTRQNELMMEMGAKASVDVTAESDPLWDCWYHFASTYEPECDKDIETDQQQNVGRFASVEPEPVYKPIYKNRAKRAERRRATAMHKRKIRRNVAAIWGNYSEREATDMCNWSFKTLKNGDRVNCPKSQSKKADMFFKKAMKTNALPEGLRDTIVEHLKWVSKYCKRNIGGRLYVDQLNRGREEAVKRELDEMMKNNINIFQPVSGYRLIDGRWVKKTAA